MLQCTRYLGLKYCFQRGVKTWIAAEPTLVILSVPATRPIFGNALLAFQVDKKIIRMLWRQNLFLVDFTKKESEFKTLMSIY